MGSGLPPPQENHKAIGFLSKIGPDPLKNHKDTKLHVPSWATIGPQAKRRFAGGPMMARFNDSGIWILSPHQVKKVVRVGHPPTNFLDEYSPPCFLSHRVPQVSVEIWQSMVRASICDFGHYSIVQQQRLILVSVQMRRFAWALAYRIHKEWRQKDAQAKN